MIGTEYSILAELLGREKMENCDSNDEGVSLNSLLPRKSLISQVYLLSDAQQETPDEQLLPLNQLQPGELF